jgi:FKBP-type peptidyl-prolyl cis-trans isomerase
MNFKLVFFSLLMLSSYTAIAQTAPPADTIQTKSGLKYVKVKAGTGKQVINGSVVKVHFVGRYTDGDIFDTSLDAKPVKLKVATGEVIKGWDEALLLMREGDKLVLVVPPALGYGEKGHIDPEDPVTFLVYPNSTLIFDLELLEVK